jgi:hypothetical protein
MYPVKGQSRLSLGWSKLDGHNQLPKIVQGVKFIDGLDVVAKPAAIQAQTAPPDPSGRHREPGIALWLTSSSVIRSNPPRSRWRSQISFGRVTSTFGGTAT